MTRDQPSPQTDPPNATAYPFYVRSAEERRRFDLAVAIATEVFDAPPDGPVVWSAARVIFSSDLPTA